MLCAMYSHQIVWKRAPELSIRSPPIKLHVLAQATRDELGVERPEERVVLLEVSAAPGVFGSFCHRHPPHVRVGPDLDEVLEHGGEARHRRIRS